jgi:arylsulfatase A-like enzyme
LTDVLTLQVQTYLQQRPYGDQPFFLQLDHFAPHGNPVVALAAPRHVGSMNGAAAPSPPNFNEQDVSDKPQGIRNRPLLSPSGVAQVAQRFRSRIEALRAVDESVDQILDTLEQTGQLANTIVVFTSDNGFEQGEHRIPMGKDYFYEESAHVPLLMRGPGLPAGRKIGKLVTNFDLTPTIVEWCGAQARLEPDGRSLVPLIAAPTLPWRRDLLLENPFVQHCTGLRTLDPYTAAEYVYVEYDYDNDLVPEEFELYDLARDACDPLGDPAQLANRWADPCYANLMRRLSARLADLRDCAGSDCR